MKDILKQLTEIKKELPIIISMGNIIFELARNLLLQLLDITPQVSTRKGGL